MFCYQCEEAAKNTGCTVKGVCGKTEEVAGVQDVLIYTLKGLSAAARAAKVSGEEAAPAYHSVVSGLFATITNANFNDEDFIKRVFEAAAIRDGLLAKAGEAPLLSHDAVTWKPADAQSVYAKNTEAGVLATANEDVRSLRELLVYGVKGMCAYAHHAMVLGYEDEDVFQFMLKALAATLDDGLSAEELTALVVECGSVGVATMALLDKANTETYGHPEITSVNIGVRENPGILISGHDLKDLEQLLAQTDGSGVDVYTHSEMLPANAYPAFKKYAHFAGNYGNAWWDQKKDFAAFNGPILMTTNCLVPPPDSYKDRVFITGVVGFPGLKRIDSQADGTKDFSALIEMAKSCPSPTEIEQGTITIGFAHQTVLSVAEKVLEAVNTGAISKFVVMAGCDGRMPNRSYYTDFAQELPKDTIILTAGCAKYRYNKLDLGDIGGIPRVLDAGQCNDSYSLAFVALKLQEILGLDDINDLPIVYNIAWYEQKAVLVLLALLSLGVKNIHIGPTLPAFVSPNVLKVLQDTFGLGGISDVKQDMALLMA